GVSGQDDRARHSWARDGPSMPAPVAAPERGESGRVAGRPGCWGALSLWLLSLCACKEKVTRPGGRNPEPADHRIMSLDAGVDTRSSKQSAKNPTQRNKGSSDGRKTSTAHFANAHPTSQPTLNCSKKPRAKK